LFGPDGVKLRVEDCKPKLLIEDDGFLNELGGYSATFVPNTRANDLAIFQYTSGTTRELPEAVKHTHRAIVTLMVAALYGTGLRPGDRFICPSSPAWGHGLWHGTLAPLALGLTIGAYAGNQQDGHRQRQIENLGRGAEQHQCDACQVGLMAHRIAEHPGEVLGQENGLDQDDDGQRPYCEAGEKSARIIAA